MKVDVTTHRAAQRRGLPRAHGAKRRSASATRPTGEHERAGLLIHNPFRGALWGSDTFVDFDQGVNHCIKQLRAALGDAAESPRYIQTLPRRGYRFIAPVEVIAGDREWQALSAKDSTPGGVGAPIDRDTTTPDVRPPHGTPGPHRPNVAYVTAFGVGAVLVALVTGQYALRTGGGASREIPPTLAVLPFATSSSDPALGLGFANAISRRLEGQRLVPVRPPRVRPGERQDQRPSAIDAGHAVGAHHVLDGEVSRSGHEISVLAQLTDVDTGTAVWSQRFRVRADELFSVEDVIAERVVGALKLRVAAADQDRLRRRYTSNAAAYEEYLRGGAALVEHTPDGTRHAIEAFERALNKDPVYALARAGLAMACADMYLRFAPTGELEQWGGRAESEARGALDLDPDLAEGHLARAAVARKREFDWSATIAASRRALVLNPNLDQAHFFIAAAYYHLGYMEEALIEMERGRRLLGTDSVEPVRIEALVALFSGRFTTARVHLEDVSRRSSQPIGDTYLALASHASASTAARASAALAGVLAAQGEGAAARVLVHRVLSRDYRDHHVAYSLGAAYAQLGEYDEALRWLRTAADTGFPCITWFERDPLLDPIRRHPLFAEALAHARAHRELLSAGLGTTGA